MKLDSVRSYVVRNPKPCIGGKYLFFIKLQTDDGLVGWGESAVLGCYVDVWKAYDPVVQGIFHARVEGRSAFDREAIAKDIYDTLCNSRPDMFGAGIISAFDIALWDIVGKHCNLPISDLLGGKTRNSVRAYSYIYPKLARGQDALEQSPRVRPSIFCLTVQVACMFFALIGALVVGLSLGALGSGGSILTVPVLTFLVGQPEKVAIAGSLVIVGGIALVGASRAWRAGA